MHCKYCKFIHANEKVLLKHYLLHHRGTNWPCIHTDCLCIHTDYVFVHALDKYVKGTVFCVCVDNLGAHGLAGFQESFNVNSFCRFCLISKSEIATTEICNFKLRSRKQHDPCVVQITDGNLAHVNGVKRECVLSKHLSHFHPITGFPQTYCMTFLKKLYW